MTSFQFDDPIVAIATPVGPSRRGVVRIAATNVSELLERCWTPDNQPHFRKSRLPQLHTGTFHLDSELDIRMDVALWPTEKSYAGQPMGEIHTIGAPALLEQVMTVLVQSGARIARPGEFSLRAFVSGRLDLIQAEAVLGVIDARGEQELGIALTQLAGGLSRRLDRLRDQLLELMADLEAGLDFVEEDIEFVSRDAIEQQLFTTLDIIERLSVEADERLLSNHRFRVVLAGLPNAGKSTLLNALAGTNTAIVSEIAGTTRDYLSVNCRLGEIEIQLIDTAGWEITAEPTRHVAQTFRQEQIREADLVLWCRPLGQREADGDPQLVEMSECRDLARAFETVWTKSDLAPDAIELGADNILAISAWTRDGLTELGEFIQRMLTTNRGGHRQLIGSTSARCRETLGQVKNAICEAILAIENGLGDEVLAFELRRALDGLGEVVGAVYTDDLLDRVFSKFCIGK